MQKNSKIFNTDYREVPDTTGSNNLSTFGGIFDHFDRCELFKTSFLGVTSLLSPGHLIPFKLTFGAGHKLRISYNKFLKRPLPTQHPVDLRLCSQFAGFDINANLNYQAFPKHFNGLVCLLMCSDAIKSVTWCLPHVYWTRVLDSWEK